MMRTILIAAALGAALTACGGGKTLVVVQNPKDGQVAQCQDDARLFGAAGRVEDCAQAYEKAGWVRLSK